MAGLGVTIFCQWQGWSTIPSFKLGTEYKTNSRAVDKNKSSAMQVWIKIRFWLCYCFRKNSFPFCRRFNFALDPHSHPPLPPPTLPHLGNPILLLCTFLENVWLILFLLPLEFQMTILWLDINLFLFQILEFLQCTWVNLIHTVVKGQILFMLLDGEKFCAC